MTKQKKSRKQIRAIKAKAKKTKGFSIWEHQTAQERALKKSRKGKGYAWGAFDTEEDAQNFIKNNGQEASHGAFKSIETIRSIWVYRHF